MALAYIDKVTSNRTAFEQKVKQIASRLGINPDWLMIVMYAESRLNHLAENPNSSATGLIQFLSKTLLQLGISKPQLLSMTNVQQLDYVEKYFVMQGLKGKMKSVYDVCFGVFLPKYVGASDSTVIANAGTDTYNANRGMDTDGDSKLTVADVKRWYGRFVPSGTPTSNQNIFLYIALAVFVLYLLYENSEQEETETSYLAQFQS